MIILGLTGSIGMGKSTAGSMLEYLGVPVHEADKAVHELLRFNSAAWPAFAAAFPYYQYPHIYHKPPRWMFWSARSKAPWAVNRTALGALVFNNQPAREKLEGLLHPFVQQEQRAFITAQRAKGCKMVALDIPLLFETGAESRVDYTITVSAPPHVQHARVLARPGISTEKLNAILLRQMPDGEKRARSDFVVHSGLGRAHMMRKLKEIVMKIQQERDAVYG